MSYAVDDNIKFYLIKYKTLNKMTKTNKIIKYDDDYNNNKK